MRDRRNFLKTLAGTAAGAVLAGLDVLDATAAHAARAAQAAQVAGGRREVSVGGKRAKVIDIHAHCVFPGVADVVKGTPLEGKIGATGPQVQIGPQRLKAIDERGIDLQVLSINVFWWYAAERDLAEKIVRYHDEQLSAWCKAHSDRFLALTSVALQFPDLAAQQLEYAVKELGFKGASTQGTMMGEPLSSPRFDPFWAKAEELGAIVFMHPENGSSVVKEGVLKGSGDLGNIIGNPLETTVFLSHMIFDGTLDRFPQLKICASHAGGYLPSYIGRSDVACEVRPAANCANKKHPSEYFKTQILVDSIILSDEGLRHLVAEVGASQVVYGTDIPFVWPDSVDLILRGNFSNEDKLAMLGGNLSKLLRA